MRLEIIGIVIRLRKIYLYKCSLNPTRVQSIARFVRDIYFSKLGVVSWVPCKYMVSLGPFSTNIAYQNYSYYGSASVIPICNPEYVIQICNLIDFSHDWLRIDQDLPFTYEGQFFTLLTLPNLLW